MYTKHRNAWPMRSSSDMDKAETDFLDAFQLGTNITTLSTQLRDFIATFEAILQNNRRSLHTLRRATTRKILVSTLHDLEPLVILLHETSAICLYTSFPPPLSAGAILHQCEAHCKKIVDALCALRMDEDLNAQTPLSRAGHFPLLFKVSGIAHGFRQDADRLGDAVMRLRHILMDSVTLGMHEEQSTILSRLAVQGSCNDLDVASLQGVPALTDNDTDGGRRPRDVTPYRQYTDSTLFDLIVLPLHGHGPLAFPARGKMDCAGDTNVVAKEVVEAAGLLGQLKDVEDSENSVGFHSLNGNVFSPTKQIQIYWRLPNDRKARTTMFYVAEQSPYQLLFGQNWIEGNGQIFKLQPAIMALVGPFVSKAKQKAKNERHEAENEAARAETAAEQEAYAAKLSAARPQLPQVAPVQQGPVAPQQRQAVPVQQGTIALQQPEAVLVQQQSIAPQQPQAVPVQPKPIADPMPALAEGIASSSQVPAVPDAQAPSLNQPAATLRPPPVHSTSGFGPQASVLTATTEDTSQSIGRQSTPDPSRPSHGTSTDITPASSSDAQRDELAVQHAPHGDPDQGVAGHNVEADEELEVGPDIEGGQAPKKGFRAFLKGAFRSSRHRS